MLTMEEHSIYGGLNAAVAQVVYAANPARVLSLAIPDEPVVTGSSGEVFNHYFRKMPKEESAHLYDGWKRAVSLALE
jgi:transketolase C-terminal domain/subunit